MTVIAPALYLFPTGLSDENVTSVVPPVNIDLMRQIRFFVVENIRTARRWIRRCDPAFSFEGVEFAELNNRTPLEEIPAMLAPLRQGNSVGVMSEAGCPAVADPGADLVAIAKKEGLKVVPLVGPSSILLSLMASGFNGQSFCFHGYLPVKEPERIRALKALEAESRRESRTQIFIETPYRNNSLMHTMLHCLSSDTMLCVASDITDRRSESILSKTVAEWRKIKVDYAKRPTIFLIYSGSRKR